MEEEINIVKKQFLNLKKEHQYLYLKNNEKEYLIVGTIFLEKDNIKDSYEIEIVISNNYPKEIPVVKEIGGKIPKEFHTNLDNTLCLEVPLRVWEIFREEETLSNFVENLVSPFLITFTLFEKTGKAPLGEHKHGAKGLLEDYKKRFNVSQNPLATNLLGILAKKNSYREPFLCPCGSGKQLRKCHGDSISRFMTDSKYSEYDFMKDYLNIMLQIINEVLNQYRDYYWSRKSHNKN